MRVLISIFTIVVFPLILVGTRSINKAKQAPTISALTYSEQTNEYCNSRFNFCINYSNILLPIQVASSNDDGVELWTAQEIGKVTVNGAHDIFNWRPEELFEFNLENTFPGKAKDAFIVSKVFGDDFYEVLLVNKGKNIFQRAYFKNGIYVQLTIEVPSDHPNLMEEIKENIEMVFEDMG